MSAAKQLGFFATDRTAEDVYDTPQPPASAEKARATACNRCGNAGAYYDGTLNGGEYAIRCACGAPVDARRGLRVEADDDFEDEDGPEYVDEGADPDAAWAPDELLDETAGNDDAAPEPAPVCGECGISATIHEWAAPHGRDGFPCAPGSFERDRAAFEGSIRAGDRRGEGEVTRVAYSRRTLDEKPPWYHERTRGDVTCYPVSNCYGTLWIERRLDRQDLFSIKPAARLA